MAEITLRTYQEILGQMISKLLAETDLNDLSPGSVFLTLLEAASSSDFTQEGKLLQLLNLRNPDKATGVDLENLAAEMGVTPSRLGAESASVVVTVKETGFSKISTTVFAGAVSPAAGDSTLKVIDASSFTPTGTIFIGRGSSTSEPINYTSVVNSGNFWTINLASPLTKNHFVSEEVVLGQGGDRVVTAGSVVRVPGSTSSPAISFKVLRAATMPNGEDTLPGIDALAVNPGAVGNVGIGTIKEFASPPWPTATVVNDLAPAQGGRDTETDPELRQRIKDWVHNLGRGTERAIIRAVVGVNDSDEGKRVVSAFLREPTITGQLGILFIDDGTGFQPSFAGVGEEIVIASAKGTEEFFQLQQFPLLKAQVTSIATEPYALFGGESLLIEIDGQTEQRSLPNTTWRSPGVVSAQEVAETINNTFTTIEARAKNGIIFITPITDDPDYIRVGTAASDNANAILRFPTRKQFTIRLYKNDVLLEKNGFSAIIQSFPNTQWPPFSSSETLQLEVDGIDGPVITVTDSDFANLTSSSNILGATVTDWATVLNTKLIGVTVEGKDDGTFTLTSNHGASNSASMKVLGGSLSGTIIDSTASATGQSSQFKLNRLLGQIELSDRLSVNDQLTAGSAQTAGFVKTKGLAAFDLATTLGSPARLVVITNASAEILLVNGTAALTFSNPSTAIQRITGLAGRFSAVLADDWVYLYNLTQQGLYRVAAVAGDGSFVDCFDPDPQTGSSTPDVANSSITFFRTAGMPQEITLPVGASVAGSSIVASINSQISGGEASVLDNGVILLTTLRLDGTGALAIPAVLGTASNLGILAGNYLSNDPHIAAIESADLAGLPSYRLTVSLPDLSSPYDQYQVNGTPFQADIDNNRPLFNYMGAASTLLRQPLEALSTSRLTLRDDIPVQTVGLGYDLRSATTTGCEFGQADNMVFIVDDDATKKTFDIPFYVQGTIAGPSVPTTLQFDANDAVNDNLGTSTRWTGHRFEDYRVWFRARADLPASVSNTQIRIVSVQYGQNGKNIQFGIFYPAVASSDPSVNFVIDPTDRLIQISLFLAGGAARSIGLTPNAPIYVTSTGPVLGVYTFYLQFVPPVDLSTVVPGDVLVTSDPNFNVANRGSMKVQVVTNLSDATRTYEHIQESISTTTISGGGSTFVLGSTPSDTLEDGDEITINSITMPVAANGSTTSTVTGKTISTITVTAGQPFVTGSGSFTVNAVNFTYTSYNSGTGVFVGVSPDPTINGVNNGNSVIQVVDSVTTSTIKVDTGGAFTVGGGSIIVASNTLTYTAYNAGTGVFSGVSPDPTGFAVPGNPVQQLITPQTQLINNVITQTTGGVSSPFSLTGDGFDVVVTHKALTLNFAPSFSAAAGDKIQVAGNILTVTGINSPTNVEVDTPFLFMGSSGGTISRVILQAQRTSAGVDESIVTSNNQGVRVVQLDPTKNIANTLIAAVNNTAGVKDLVTASNVIGSDGTGIIASSTDDELMTGDTRVNLLNGESFIYSTSTSSPAFRVKVPLDMTPEVGESVRFVPMTPQNIRDHLNRKQISGLSIAANVDLVNGARRVQVSTLTPGGTGQVFAVGGKASGNNTLAIRSTGQEIDSSTGLIELDRAALDLLAPGHMIFISQTGRAKKNFVSSSPISSTTIQIQIVTPGIGRLTFGVPLASTLSYTHTGTVTWDVRRLTRGRIRFELFSGTASLPGTLKAGDFVLIGNGSSYAGFTPAQIFASSNTGYFQIRETDSAVYFDVDAIGAEQFVNASSAPFVFIPYHSARIGDQVAITDTSPLSSANRGTFAITAVNSATIIEFANPNVANEGPTALGVGGEDSLRILDSGYSTYRKVLAIAPSTIDPTNRSIVVVTPGTDISLLNEGQGAIVSLPNRLGFTSDPVPGISGYQYWTGLKRRVQRTLDGYEPDPTTFPGVRAAGVAIEAREPQIQRVSLNIKVKTKNGVALPSITDSIKSSIIGFVNSLGLGVSVVLSEIVSLVQGTAGVDSVVLVNPTLDTERITINDNAIARTSATEILLS